MKSLEQIAKKMFSDYAMKHAGHYLDWRFLSAERRLAWMMEVGNNYLECLKQVKEDLSLNKLPKPGAASYEKGFIAGQAHEAHRLNERIMALQEDIQAQLDKFILTEASKDVD